MEKTIKITINKIKSISHATLELPFDKGLYALIGNNGTGKSTIIYSLAQLINKNSLVSFGVDVRDGDSYVEFEYGDIVNRWDIKQDKYDTNNIYLPTPRNQIHINGMYEGSLFFGFRFKNHNKVMSLMREGSITIDSLCAADDYIVEQLGYILHGDKAYYKQYKIKRIKNKKIVHELGLNETPYFMFEGERIVSQYAMSSGECITLSLLHFIFHSIIRRSLDEKLPILMLIDEIELALHPIAVSRLLELLQSLVKERENLIIFITSHAAEVINKIPPQDLYLLETTNDLNNSLRMINPCYPAYAIRDVYRHDGFDWLLLVEDELAKNIVNDILFDLGLSKSKLIHVTPVGGWFNTLKLQYDLINCNVLGAGKHIVSILDGDIESECNKREFRSTTKLFLPIASIEKFLKKVLLDEKNETIFKEINDNLFPIKSLKEIINEYNQAQRDDNDGKRLFNLLISEAKKTNIDSAEFLKIITKIIKEHVDFTRFNASIKKLLES